MPKISVIMGVYNCTSYDSLKKSVDSIINQTFKDWEFIICNDGSTNNTLEMLNKMKSLDDRIKILSYKENKGLANALNCCIKHSTGDFIARQDDNGDISKLERLEKQIKFLNENLEYDFVGSNCLVFNEKGVYGGLKHREIIRKNDFLWNSPFIHATVMFRRRALNLVGGYRIAKETKRCEDYDLFMRMYAIGLKGYNIQENLYNYKVLINKNKKYRPMNDRIDEAIVRFRGFKAMKNLIIGIPFIIKPILIGLIPSNLFAIVQKNFSYKGQC